MSDELEETGDVVDVEGDEEETPEEEEETA